MEKKRLITLSLLMIFNFSIFAQDAKPSTSALTFEVLNTSLKNNKEPQNIKILINCNDTQDIPSINLLMPQIKAMWSMVSTRLNGQSLWLIKSERGSNNANVLAWDLNAQESQLILYPGKWPTPYTLELEIQVNLKESEDSLNNTTATMIMEAVIAGRSYQCSPTGRGNQLSMQ